MTLPWTLEKPVLDPLTTLSRFPPGPSDHTLQVLSWSILVPRGHNGMAIPGKALPKPPVGDLELGLECRLSVLKSLGKGGFKEWLDLRASTSP